VSAPTFPDNLVGTWGIRCHACRRRGGSKRDCRELKTAFGLDHFEGRSWNGWHRHVTFTAAAQLFLAQLRRTGKAPGRPEPLRRPPRGPVPPRDLARVFPLCHQLVPA